MMSDKRGTEDPKAEAVVTESEDFQYALRALLAAYQPVLEQQLNLIANPQELQRQLQAGRQTCAEEFAEAYALFEKFLTEDVAQRLLPAQARELLGPIEQWRWCFLHIRCCLVFGWLACRWPRTFRGFAYYLYEYWRCVRQVIGNPVSDPPTAEQRRDFETLVNVLAAAFKPYLSDQLASVEFPAGVPQEVIAGTIDCFTDDQFGCQIFERLLTTEAARALFGEAAFQEHSQQPSFWFCRCWCLCSLCFGCCLGRARSIPQIVVCFQDYLRCLGDCFRPLTCELTDPQGCVAEQGNVALSAIGVDIDGTAAGLGFSHYILEWSQDSITWFATNFNYPPIPPGGGTQGNIPVVSGLLAFLDTTTLNEGLTFIRMTVVAVNGTTRTCGPINFELFRQDVRITGIDYDFNLNTNPYDPAAEFIETVPALCTRPSGVFEVSFGESITVQGSAFVGGCAAKQIRRYSLDYQPGFVTDPMMGPWTNFWNVFYGPDPNQFLVMNERRDNSDLIAAWGAWTPCWVNPVPPHNVICGVTDPQGELYPTSWPTTFNPPCGFSGLVTLRLTVEDAANYLYYDTQRIWLDNKWPCAAIRITAVPPCAVVNLSQFANPPDCSVPWQLPLVGIAYDEYIDYALPFTRPNDNFDFYRVKVAKQGGSWVQIPVPGPGGSCFFGTSRVGDPVARCISGPYDPAHLDPSAILGLLTNFDLRALDPLCSSQVPYSVPPDLLLPRGECCDYMFWLWVQDRTIFSGGPHWAEAFWPVRICNDLKS